MHDSSLSIRGQHGPSAARYWARRIIAGLIAVTVIYLATVGAVTLATAWAVV